MAAIVQMPGRFIKNNDSHAPHSFRYFAADGMSLTQIVQYFRSCYQVDMKATHLLNFLGKKVSLLRIETDAAWISSTWHSHAVPSDWGTAVHKHLLVHSKEQQLYAGAFMLTGQIRVLGRSQDICAPLYLLPANLTLHETVFMVELDYAGMTINPAFAEALQQDEALSEGLLQQLQQQLPTHTLGFDTQHAIEKVLGDLTPAVQLDRVFDFPMNIDLDELKNQVQQQQQGFRLLPVLGLGIMDKQVGSLGILNELQSMAASGVFSPVVHSLFGTEPAALPKKTPLPIVLPVTLSASQEAIVANSATARLSLVNGPPGTGKSFTIAAIAADRLSKGESVLIATKNMQAVEVIADKLERDFQLPGICIRATQKEYRKHLRKRLKDWLYGSGIVRVDAGAIQRKRWQIARLDRKIQRLSASVARQEQNELQFGALIQDKNPAWYRAVYRRILEFQIMRGQPLWALMDELEHVLHESRQEAGRYLLLLFHQRLQEVLKRHRRDLQTFWEALKARTGNEKESHFQDVNFSNVLQALPVWLVNTGNLHQVLPLTTGLFDLVIIDEASQLDIASALPLLQRAKRAVVVGDPKQLRHVSFLSREQQRNFAEQFGLTQFKPQAHLSFRDTSVLDLTADRIAMQDQVHMLDEHFRSLPGIIAFSNRYFYDGRLKIMTATPQNKEEVSVFIHQVPGKRTASGQNKVEAEALLADLAALIAAEAALSTIQCQSIGILSPFRSQVDWLKRLCSEKFTTEQWQRHHLLIGTPFDFQGEERDVMLLSWAVDRATAPGAIAYLNREDVFNVSITRARAAQHHYLSVEARHLLPNNLLRTYLTESIAQQQAVHPAVPADAFMKEVLAFLQQQGIVHYLTHYHIAGVDVDLVITHQGKTYCIDCVGFPGLAEKALPLARWKILARIGVFTFVLPYSLWYLDRSKCEDALLRFLVKT
jgi:AAA domain